MTTKLSNALLLPEIETKFRDLFMTISREIINKLLEEHLTPLKKQIAEQQQQAQMKTDIDNIHIIALRSEIADLKEQLLKKTDEQEQYSRRNPIRVSDLPEKRRENSDDVVLGVLSKVHEGIKVTDIDRCHRVGKKGSDPRQVIVKFVSYRVRKMIISNRRKLKKSPESDDENADATLNNTTLYVGCVYQRGPIAVNYSRRLSNEIGQLLDILCIEWKACLLLTCLCILQSQINNDHVTIVNPVNHDATDHVLSFFHLNTRSIRNKISYLSEYLSDFNVISFTETHLDKSFINDNLIWDNFHEPIRKDRNMFGGGVMVYLNKMLNFKRLCHLENDYDETIWIQYFYQTNPFYYVQFTDQNTILSTSGLDLIIV